MPVTTPILNIGILDTHDIESLAIIDYSQYPPNWNTVAPTIQIKAPGNDTVTLEFTPSSIQIYNSATLGITCDWCEGTELPDGIYSIKYSVYPAYKYYVEKTITRVDRIQSKLDYLYLQMDFTVCDDAIKREDRLALDTVQFFINGSIAAGNKCDNRIFESLYKKANRMLEQYTNKKSCVKH